MTHEEAEARVLADYAAVAGRLVRVGHVMGFADDDSDDVYPDPPALMRISRHVDEGWSLLRWNREWIDPYWDATLVEPHPQLAHLRSFYVDGTSYSLDGGVERAKIKVVPENPLLLRLRWLAEDAHAAWCRWRSRGRGNRHRGTRQ
jgi:hypothetical protein